MPMSSFATLYATYVYMFKRVGSRIARGGVEAGVMTWGGMATAWDWSGQGFAPVRPKLSPQARV